MPGGLIQLVAVGIQDEKLTQDPDITFFKAGYRAYINFACEAIEQTFSGTAGFNKRVQSELSRNGDLVKDALLEITLPALSVSGVAGTAESQRVVSDTSAYDAGTYRFEYEGVESTDLAFNATLAVAQDAIDAMSSIVDAGGVTLSVVGAPATGSFDAAAVGFDIAFTNPGVRSQVNIVNHMNDGGVGGFLIYSLNTAGVAPGTIAWAPNIGHRVLKEMSVQIGGQTIDRHYGRWYDVWTELTLPEEKRRGFNEMIGQQNLTEVAADEVAGTGVSKVTLQYDGLQTLKTTHASTKLFVPLKFWFNVNPGLALPIIALQYHQIKMLFEFRPSNECVVLAGGSASTAVFTPSDIVVSLWIDYVFLDNSERRNYAQTPHEYLIDQLQFTGAEAITGSSPKIRLNFNHPVQELVWVLQEDHVENTASGALTKVQQNQHDDYAVRNSTTLANRNPVTNAKLQLNGQDRFAVRDGEYFNLVQAHNHHSRIPYKSLGKSRGILVYSFALQPEDYQPNGTANFSRIDTAVLNLTMRAMSSSNPGKVYVYARNYNLFRIASGMGGLAYAS